MATYRIGPDDFFTGGDLQADAKTLNSQVQGLDRVVSDVPNGDPRLTDDMFASWAGFTSIWNSYYQMNWATSGDIANFFAALNDGNRDQLIQLEERFADLAARLKAAGIDSAAVNVAVSLGAPDTVTRLLADLDSAAKKLLPFGLGLGAFLMLALAVWFFVLPRLTHV